jgi:hypothetical protein
MKALWKYEMGIKKDAPVILDQGNRQVNPSENMKGAPTKNI